MYACIPSLEVAVSPPPLSYCTLSLETGFLMETRAQRLAILADPGSKEGLIDLYLLHAVTHVYYRA